MKFFKSLLFSMMLFLPSLSLFAADDKIQEDIIVIGDIHGAYDEFTGLLKELNIVDDNLDWQAGKKHLVSLGDLVDRGAGSKAVIELIMKLHKQAEQAGGKLHLVLGNHEVMLMTGDFRYVSDIEFAAFAELETKEDREKLINFSTEHLSIKKDNVANLFPTGFMGLVRAYQGSGYIGKWLRKHAKAVVKINDAVFVHGGISENTAQNTLEEINLQASKQLNNYSQSYDLLIEHGALPFTLNDYHGLSFLAENASDFNDNVEDNVEQLNKQQSSLLFSPTGPFWYRGNAYCPELSESYALEKAQAAFGIDKIFVGHSIRYHQLVSRFDGRVFLSDTGMNKAYYQGNPSAYIISAGKVSAHHFNNTPKSLIYAEPLTFRANPRGMSDKAVEDFLLKAEVIATKYIGEGMTKSKIITLQQGERKLRALFKKYNNNYYDRYQHEVAAYKIDRMMGQYLIPPAVIRTIRGDEGVVQLWAEDMITENNRLDDAIEYTGMCSMTSYLRMRIIFDTLIGNIDRNNGNFLWDKEFFLTFIDHSHAFGLDVEFPKMYRKSKILLSQKYRDILSSLNKAELKQAVGLYLKDDQIKALLARRDLIMKTF